MQLVLDTFPLMFEALITQLDMTIQVVTGYGKFLCLFHVLELKKVLYLKNPLSWILHAIIT